jgi:hypothetical protein
VIYLLGDWPGMVWCPVDESAHRVVPELILRFISTSLGLRAWLACFDGLPLTLIGVLKVASYGDDTARTWHLKLEVGIR